MRIDFDSYREIADSLVRNKSRSLLTGFGVFWGVFMLLFLSGGGDGLKVVLYENFNAFATNAVILFSGNTSEPYQGFKEDRSWNLTNKDIDRLKLLVPEAKIITPTIARWGEKATNGEHTTDISLKGINPEYGEVEIPTIKYGRYLNEMDCLQERKVCIIGKRIYEALFPDGGDPCGKQIQIGSIYYTVVGVEFGISNMSINGNSSQSVLMPISVAQKVYNTGNEVDLIALVAHDGVLISDIEKKIRTVIARNHCFNPGDKSALFVFNTQEMYIMIDNIFKGVNLLLLLVGTGTILAGIIGVSNIMMVTVKERTTEIGIRRAIGATPRMILGQIISESISLTLIAGCFGIVFSVLLLQLLEIITKKACFQVDFSTAVLAALLLTVLGVIAGLAPARRAMRIKPVDAMRDE